MVCLREIHREENRPLNTFIYMGIVPFPGLCPRTITWYHKEMKNRQTHGCIGKLEWGNLGSMTGKPRHPEAQCVYCIQLNEEAVFILHSWVKEMGLANLSRSSLLLLLQTANIRRERIVINVFFTCSQHSHSDLRVALPSPWASSWGEGFANFPWGWGTGVFGIAMSKTPIPSGLHGLPTSPPFLRCLQWILMLRPGQCFSAGHRTVRVIGGKILVAAVPNRNTRNV